ncbi:MAG: carboxypeptidase regulatory-like domain-containing protein [Vicinamibacterales bacterium]
MRRTAVLLLWWAMTLVLSVAGASAQGVQTGILRGLVVDQQDLPVPGVAVTAESGGLQGSRTTRTESDGSYVFSALPPGDYVVAFEIAGFATVERTAVVPLGAATDVDVTLMPAGVAEDVQVVGTLEPVETTAPVGLNIRQMEVEALATSRTLQGIATLSPGLNENTPNSGQVSISGAFAYDNLFMLNGVDVNDNLFGTPQDLFIEDAIAETQVLTSGLTAEYGRFTGGVINAITKSGGNEFSGSYRLNLSNPSWTDETPFETENGVEFEGKLDPTHEMTFGGPIVRDSLWFFAAGRFANLTTPTALPVSGFQIETEDKNRRGEIKVTATPIASHTFTAGYLNNYSESIDSPSIDSQTDIDPNTLINDQAPNWYAFANYRGVVGSNWLAETQYSERRFRFENNGGTSKDIHDSPIFTTDFLYLFNAPYFDGSDPEERNNRQFTANVTRFFEGAGRHEAKAGYEFFRSQVTGGGGQSSTDFVFYADYVTNPDGSPQLDANGRFIPIWIPFDPTLPGWSGYDNWRPVRGAHLNIDTQSFFLQDRWAINRNLTANLGFRFENVQSDADGVLGADTSTIVPRVALAFDPVGDGRTTFNTSYSHYAGRYNEATFSANGNVSQPNLLLADYIGPPGVGLDFAPAFDTENYAIFFGRFPTANVSFEDGLSTAIVREFTLSANRVFGDRASGEIAYVWRDTTNVIEDFTNLSNGITAVEENGVTFGPFTNSVYRNTDIATRRYQSLVFQGNLQVLPNWSVNGHWTIQLQNEGNYEGEGPGQPALVSIIGDFPEVISESRHYPTGRLANFQRHRVRLWSIYNASLASWGDLSISGLVRLESAGVYSLAATQGLTDFQNQTLFDLGYPDAPPAPTLFFGDRGSESFAGYGALDLSVNYNLPIWGTAAPWIKLDLFNAFNNDKLTFWNTTVEPDFEGELDELGLPTGYVEDSDFGRATSAASFPDARRFRMSVGFRF